MSKKLAIFNIVILSSLLTLFNNCGNSTYIDQTDLAAVDPEVRALLTSAPKLTAASYQVESGKTITLTIQGGEAPYTYEVNPASAGSVDGSNVFHSNQPGVSAISVTDNLGRTSAIAVDIKPKPTAAAPQPAAQNTTQANRSRFREK